MNVIRISAAVKSAAVKSAVAALLACTAALVVGSVNASAMTSPAAAGSSSTALPADPGPVGP